MFTAKNKVKLVFHMLVVFLVQAFTPRSASSEYFSRSNCLKVFRLFFYVYFLFKYFFINQLKKLRLFYQARYFEQKRFYLL